MTPNELIEILRAKSAKEIFGPNKDEVYRILSLVAHPDRGGSAQLFQALNTKFAELDLPPVTIASKRATYTFSPAEIFAKGDIANFYRVDNKLLKITNDPNISLDIERSILKECRSDSKYEKIWPYLPKLLDSFKLPSGQDCNVTEYEDDWYTLEQYKMNSSNGLNPRLIAFIFKRIMVGCALLHKHKHVHGAILPSHILINQFTHGGRLLGLYHSQKIGNPIRTISPIYKDLYAPEIFKKGPSSPTLDIYMAASTCLWLGGDELKNEPKLVQFLEGLLIKVPKYRLDDCMAIHTYWDELLAKLFGKPKFENLHI